MGRGLMVAVVVLAAALGNLGCADTSEDAAHRATVDTLPSGAVRVANSGEGLWTEETAWSLEPDLRIGRVEGGGPETFSQIAFLLTGPDDELFVLEHDAREVRVFRPDGSFSHRFGRQGQGPGEFVDPWGLTMDEDGRLWIWESQRYSVFEPEGEFVTSHPRLLRGVIFPWNGGFTAGGRLVDWGLDREASQVREESGFVRFVSTGLTTFHPVVFTPPDRFDTMPPVVFTAETTSDGQLKRGRTTLSIELDRDGSFWFAETGDYTVSRRTLAGDTTLVFSKPYVRMPVPQAEIDSIIRASEASGFPALEEERFARFRRMVTRILTDGRGYVYVFPQEEGVLQGTAIDVFRVDGHYLGRMELPDTVLISNPPPHVTATHLYAVTLDEFDVPFIVRYRFVRPSR